MVFYGFADGWIIAYLLVLPSLTNVRLAKIPVKSVESRSVAKILPFEDGLGAGFNRRLMVFTDIQLL